MPIWDNYFSSSKKIIEETCEISVKIWPEFGRFSSRSHFFWSSFNMLPNCWLLFNFKDSFLVCKNKTLAYPQCFIFMGLSIRTATCVENIYPLIKDKTLPICTTYIYSRKSMDNTIKQNKKHCCFT